MTEIQSLLGVYDADGGLRGEAAYVIGSLLGRVHCGLCDITHSPVRRKPAWDAMVARLGVPFVLRHRNEADVAGEALPAVFGQRADGSRVQLLGPAELDRLDGSVPAFEAALAAALVAAA